MDTSYYTTPFPWAEYPMECFLYVWPMMGIFHLILFAVGCVILLFASAKEPSTYARRIRRFGLFLFLLLFVGALFNGFWSCLIWGRYYYSLDYVFDFSPFWPITQGIIEAPFGDQHGALLRGSLFQLQCIWFLFAAGTWTVTIFLYRRIRGHLEPAPAIDAAASTR
jgi:hypothetical protein